jgi:serine/threonine protein kinase
MTILTPESLLTDLKVVPLLTPEQLARVEAAARRGTYPTERMVLRLIEKGWLTPYQGDTLLAGRATSLRFGPYILLDRLGEGGMGVVFKARHQRLGRVDALKVIRADKVASKVVARRFLREIRLTSSLEHPNIVRAIDAGQVGRQFYLATEFVQGEDLFCVVMRSGPLSLADACLAVYQVTLALQHIHERGLVHRDIKPSNLMRENATRAVKLLDLGLTGFHRDPDPGSQPGILTSDGVLLGTPDFMAPEQARTPHDVDIRADLYALGGTLFFLLTGRVPYPGSSVDKLLAHASAPVPELHLVTGPAPPAVSAIIARLMAKRPEDRYQTPREVTDALLALRPGETPTSIEVASDELSFSDTPPPPADEWRSEFDQLLALDGSNLHPVVRPTTPHNGSDPVLMWVFILVTSALTITIATLFIARNL